MELFIGSKNVRDLTAEELQKLPRQQQEVLALARAGKLEFKSYDEFVEKNFSAATAETFGVQDKEHPTHFFLGLFDGREKVRQIHVMVAGSCLEQGPVLCFKFREEGSLIFSGIHGFKECPGRKYEINQANNRTIKTY